MSDSFFDEPYDPVATPNPAYYDDDLEPAPRHCSAWERRSLSQAMLARARARQDAIADAFVNALLDGKLSFFRLLMDLEKAAIAGEAEAQQARQPTLAEILIPTLERERKEAAAAREAAEPQQTLAPQPTAEPAPARPMLVAPISTQPVTPPQPGTTDLNAAAKPEAERPCRTRARKRYPQRPSRNPIPPTQIPGQLRSLHACRHALLRRSSGRPRTSTRCLQHPLFFDALQAPLQKIDLHHLLTDLALQLRHTAFGPAPLPVTRKRVARRLTKLTPPTLQHVRIDLQSPCDLGQRYPRFQPPNGGQLEFPGELPA